MVALLHTLDMAELAYGSRVASLASALKEAGLDALFGWSPVTMGYLHGFKEGAHERFLTLAIHADGRVRLICPALSESQARRAGIEDIHSWRDGEDPLPLFERLGDDWNLRSGILGVDDELPAQMLLKMQGVLPAALFKAGGPVVSSLMQIKDEQELAQLRKAGKIADDAYDAALARIKPGMTEMQVDGLLREEMRAQGGKPTFCIVAAGAAGAEPHHVSDHTPLKQGDVVLLDFGCEVEGYQSDITRVLCLGAASADAMQAYDVVFRAHYAGRKAIQPGVTAESIDAAARKVIEDAGFGEFFVHRTGHGLGLRGHEDPYIVAGNDEELKAGQVFSVEPGIYFPGSFGVRIENIVTVTGDGHESLNREPSPTLLEL